jgi:predicted DNA-binding transcriptional regulator YafY
MSRTDDVSRIDRLDLLVRVIRDRAGITTRELAIELGVSARSIFRDIDHLRSRGYPIEADRGRGGGLRLSHRWGIGNVLFSNEESLSLLLSLGIAEQAAIPMFSAAVARARKKIVDAFPRRDRDRLNALRERIVIGQNASATVRGSYGEPEPSVMLALQVAFIRERLIAADYVNECRQRTRRRLEPHVLLINWPAWYLLAHDYASGEPRTFRLDRLKSALVVHDIFRPQPREITNALLGRFGVPSRTI